METCTKKLLHVWRVYLNLDIQYNQAVFDKLNGCDDIFLKWQWRYIIYPPPFRQTLQVTWCNDVDPMYKEGYISILYCLFIKLYNVGLSPVFSLTCLEQHLEIGLDLDMTCDPHYLSYTVYPSSSFSSSSQRPGSILDRHVTRGEEHFRACHVFEECDSSNSML